MILSEAKELLRCVCKFTTLVVFLLSCAAFAQAPQAQPQPTPAPQAQPAPAQPEHRITPQEAKELLDAVDDVLAFDSKTSALPIKGEVKRRLADREEVQHYIETRLREDEDAERLKNAEVVLKKLGLLPRDFNLDIFLVQMLKEQVAGYYDEKTKTVNLLNWLEPEAQMPVLAHELTHALQDQNYGLEKWIRGDKKGKSDVLADEELAARHAVVEGQAMAVMIDWMLAPTGQSILSSPLIAEAMEAGMMSAAGSPEFARAPLYLKRVLLFPYTYGLDFERELLAKGGRERAYAGVFRQPPLSTRQVMEPAVYLAGEKLAPLLPPPDLDQALGKDWEKYDVGAIGEFDVAAIAEQFADLATAKKIYPNWRGGYYFAARKKGASATGPESIGLVFVTRWANPGAAHAFQVLYDGALRSRRYRVTRSLKADPPMWATTEGAVSLSEAGDMVIAIESLDPVLHDKIRTAVMKAAASSQ